MRISQTPAPPRQSAQRAFSALPLAQTWLDALAQSGYDAMTPVQAAVLPLVLAGHDLILPMPSEDDSIVALAVAVLHRLDPRRFDVQALVFCPTRDRAERVAQCAQRIARCAGYIKVATLCNGASMRQQIDRLIHGAHIAVGTPGRLLDHVDAASLDLRAVNTLVFDEADLMLDMGFVDDLAFVASRCPKARQTLLLHGSADPEPAPDVVRLGRRWMRRPRMLALIPPAM
ncbi:DEAD/DEAH box helicase [Cupriavidus pauculus]|jgi:ATP-independent RNA helicase DbpA|uniref:DEAD/DEAH box helicase n=1 Tax=Cupriavidus pauculus TaxID=82633 RepID=UPI0030F7561D